MGFWGVDLYQNDISLDVKEQFEEQLRKGKSVEVITRDLEEEYAVAKDDLLEECAFWFALADTQWTLGVLLPYVKERVLHLLQNGGDMDCWQNKNLVTQMQRKRVLYDLQYNLLSPQPQAKKPSKRRIYRCEWKVGDVFAYRLESDLAKEKGLWGRYFLIQKVDEGTWHPGHVIPIVYVKITDGENLPASLEEYNRLEYVQTSFTKYEDRLLPLDGRRLKEDIEEKSKINYETDEFGFLPEFRIRLLNTSKKIIPTNLIYLGNFLQAVSPKIEFIPHVKTNISRVFWENGEDTFEANLIERYCNHNLRQLSIYSQEKTDLGESSLAEVIVKVLEN